MLKQIIQEKKELPVKYHGKVVHIVFECNNCHKSFMQKESYYKKQLKRRKYACCFCSPSCRTKYQISNRIPQTTIQNTNQNPKSADFKNPDTDGKKPQMTQKIPLTDNPNLEKTSVETKQQTVKKSGNGFFSSFLKGLLGK